ncbi:MAG: NUDIX domain-containing protein [Granulosicoccaceae bacterium]
MTKRVKILDTALLSDSWAQLSKISFEYLRSDGQWQHQEREVYNRGDGAAILLYNLEQRTVVLIKQFRLPVYLDDNDGFLIEVPAGVLEQNNPEQTIRSETEQETGYRVSEICQLFSAYVSPGSITERIHYYHASYTADQRIFEGGGLDSEGEDIEVMEVAFDDAMAWITTGQIQDAKTVLLLQHAALTLFNV